MSKPNQNKPGGKPGQRGRKLDSPQSQKPDQAPGPSLKSAKQPDVIKPTAAPVAAPAAIVAPAAIAAPVAIPSPHVFSIRGVAPANTPSIDFQTIAQAYGDYTRKSFEQTRSFVEKLLGVRSLDKAIEIQTEFAKQAYETYVAESQKIGELYSGLARQTVDGAVAKILPAAR